MAIRNLSLEQFNKLSKKEKQEQYRFLSPKDKFYVRQATIETYYTFVPCNNCKNRENLYYCKAFPNGINGEHIKKLINNNTIECNNGFKYEPKYK